MKYAAHITLLSVVLLLVAALVAFSAPRENEEMNRILVHLQESEQYILQMLADVEPAHWTHKIDAASWSISESAEHILIAEQGILKSIQNQIATEEPTDKTSPNTDEHILGILYDRVNKKVKTLEPFEPKGHWETRDEFIQAFMGNREALYSFLDETKADLNAYYTQSPAGEVSLRQMLLVLSGHTARHTHQIEEVKHTLGLKTATLAFGGSVKVNAPASEREAIRALFGDILLKEIDVQEKYDRVLFDDGGLAAFVYHEDESRLLSKDAFANSMQAGLRTTPAFYESIKRRIISSGAEVFTPEYPVNPDKDFYFHAPGGQVFRLVKVDGASL